MDKPHKKLDAWKLALLLVDNVYALTASFPREERFGLSIQMRRAAIGVASNIAEGAARDSSREFIRFLNLARGSLSELDTQLEIACMLGYRASDPEGVDALIVRVDQTLAGLIRSRKRRVERAER